MQQKLDSLQKQMTARDAELEQARKDAAAAQATAADATRKLEETQQAIGPQGSAVTALQSEVTALKSTSASISSKVEETKTLGKEERIVEIGLGEETAHKLVDWWGVLNLGRGALLLVSGLVGVWTVIS